MASDADLLTGSSAEEQDWFFFNGPKDRATDLSDDAFAGDLDLYHGVILRLLEPRRGWADGRD